MADRTSSIEWTDATWNPVTGCSKVSPGCARCYAETFAERWRGTPGHPYEQGFDVRLWPERLDVPLRWRRPRMVFVNSMSDLFHEAVPDEFIARVFAVMAAAPHHTFQVLTKRPERMRDWFTWLGVWINRCGTVRNHFDWAGYAARLGDPMVRLFDWPLPNVWLGVSIENRRFTARADYLRETPAAVRFVSAEPLLGPLVWDAGDDYAGSQLNLDGIDWLICGGESGPGARRFDPDWARDLRDACRESGTAFFMKQMGSRWAREHGQRSKGGDPGEWPEDLRVREIPGRLA